RRNRLNGWLHAAPDGGWDVAVGQSFGNCPKYIHPREAMWLPAGSGTEVVDGTALDAGARAITERADTFFIATAHPQARSTRERAHGVDVSHRGGPAGFVTVDATGDLLVPDYVGNSFFNTLGNLQLEPRCGLLFIDFATGERVHLACRAFVLAERPDPLQWPGALRLLRIEAMRAVRVQGGLPVRWQ